MNIKNILVENAAALAIKAHFGQKKKKKYTGEPYFFHVFRVAEEVRKEVWGKEFDGETVASAIVHDLLEDTSVTFEELEKATNTMVATMVQSLTQNKHLQRRERHIQYNKMLSEACVYTQIVKAFDMMDNTENILNDASEFAMEYLNEKMDTLKILTKLDVLLYKRVEGHLLERMSLLQ